MSGLNFEEHPEGTRFLYRKQGGTFVLEDRVAEWSGSRSYVRLRGSGWISAKEASSLVVLETLDSRPDLDEPKIPYWA